MSARIAWRARSIVRTSSHWATANRNTTLAASSQSPSSSAPTTATTISVLMSRVRDRMAVTARRAGKMPPATAAARNRPPPRRAWPAAAARQAGDDRHAGRQHQPPAPLDVRPAGGRLLVLEPHPHAGLADGIDHRGRRQPGGVVLHVQPLADEVGRHGLEPVQRLQPPLEDDHLLVAVHPLDAEDRFRVQLARRAGGGRRWPAIADLSRSPTNRPARNVVSRRKVADCSTSAWTTIAG